MKTKTATTTRRRRRVYSARAMGRRIETLRCSKGMTRADLAKATGNTPIVVTWWETGQTSPSSKNMHRLCRVLDCSSDHVLGLSD